MARPSSSSTSHLVVALLAVLCAILWGCGKEAQPGQEHRFIATDAAEELGPWLRERARIVDSLDTASITLRGMVDADTDADGAHGRRVRATSQAASLAMDLDVVAERIDTVELELRGAHRRPVRMFWAKKNSPFNRQRRLEAATEQESARGTAEVYVFDVADHERWRGRLGRLRFNLSVEEGWELEVVGVRLLGTELGEDEMEQLAGQPWKVDIDQTVRNALVCPPGNVIERQMSIPEGAVLRFAYGAFPRPKSALTFRVSVEPKSGDRRVVFESALRPAVDEAGGAGWHPAEVDLAEYAGQVVTLGLTVQPRRRRTLCCPLWAHPEVVAPSPRDGRPNVVLISVDTLRADRLSLYGHERATTTAINAWAADGAAVFDNVVAPSPWTKPSHVSMMSGLDALHHGVNFAEHVPLEPPMLAERFRQQGYRTVAVTGGVYLHPEWGFQQGFDEFHYWDLADHEAELRTGIETAMETVRGSPPAPFFLFLHTYEVHAPFRRRQPYYSRFSGEEPQPERSYHFATSKAPTTEENGYRVTRRMARRGEGAEETILDDQQLALAGAAYDSGVAYADAQLGRLFELLRTSGLEDSTIVVLTSDHGEALGERGFGGHTCLYDFILRIPLVIKWPQGLPGPARRIETQVRLVDVAPTVVDLAGLPPMEGADGVSLRSLMVGRGDEHPGPAWSYAGSTNFGVSVRVGNRYKYLFNDSVWPTGEPEEELYDLEADRHELHNLADEDVPVEQELAESTRQMLEAAYAGVEVEVHNTEDGPITIRLEMDGLNTSLVKSSSCPEGRVRWLRGGAIQLDVLPGDSWSVVLEAPPSQEGLELELSGPTGQSMTTVVDVEPRGAEAVMVLEDSSWQQRRQESGDGGSFVAVRNRGDALATMSRDLAADPRFEEQLRALGYVE